MAAGNVKVTGKLIAGPTSNTEGVFPSGVTILDFTLNPVDKGYTAAVGPLQSDIASPAAFVELGGIDLAEGGVSNAKTVYVRTSAAVEVRITQLDGAVPTPAQEVKTLKGVLGLLMFEAAANFTVQKIEVKGTATVEWAAFGS